MAFYLEGRAKFNENNQCVKLDKSFDMHYNREGLHLKMHIKNCLTAVAIQGLFQWERLGQM